MASSDEMTLSLFESRYKNRQYIGSGGFAKVYKAFDHAKNHYVALKVADVRPEWKQFTLQREVELVNKLPPHPNIARYDACYRFDMGVAGEIDFAILKFYEDGNLEQFITKRALPTEDIRIIIKGILRGISFLHNNNYVHRDLKAQNILIQRDDGVWTPKITDFGLSRSMGADSTTNNSAIGMSYAYAAPEQIQNRRIFKNVDIWAAGVIMYRILTGELPFKANKTVDDRDTQSQLELSRKIVNVELPEKLNQIEEPFQAMIRRCLIADPKERCQSAEELLSLLDGEKPFTGNFNEEEDAFHQGPTIFVPVEPEQLPMDEKTRVIQTPEQPAAPPKLAPSRPPAYEAPAPVPSPVAPPSQQRQEPPPVSPSPAMPTTNYETPKAHYTQIIQQEKKPQTPPPPPAPKPSLQSGEPSGRRLWLWVAIPLLLLAGSYAAYKFLSPKKTSASAYVPKPVYIPTYEQLRDGNRTSRGNPVQLDSLAIVIEKAATLHYPNDYRFAYEMAINRTWAEKYDDAFEWLKKAGIIAIDQRVNAALAQQLRQDSGKTFSQLVQTMPGDWESLLNGIRRGDKFWINGLK